MKIPEIRPPQYIMTSAVQAVRAAIDDAVRLGLTWRLRPGTVGGSGVAAPESVPVVVDGDSAQVRARSMVGALASGQRVWCVQIPPAGIYVLGIIGAARTRMNPIAFTSNGTWTKPAGLSYIRLRMVGGGGAGGGAATTAAGQSSMGGGGGGGCAAEGIFEAVGLPPTVAVTVGSGGSGASGAAGGDGGTSLFGSLASASGGSGGAFRTASAVPHGVEGGNGGTTVTGSGMIEFAGDAGETGWGSDNGLGISGGGGSSHFGGGGRGRRTTSAGQGLTGSAGDLYGGGGAGSINSGSTSQRAGGAGRVGVVIVEEFYA